MKAEIKLGKEGGRKKEGIKKEEIKAFEKRKTRK